MGYIDFEDDPTAVLPLPLCHGRDALCYAHSTAIYLRQCGALEDARPLWAQWLQARGPALQEVMEQTMHRMRFARHLPQSRKLGVMCSGCGRRTICCAPEHAPTRSAPCGRLQPGRIHREAKGQSEKAKGQTQYARRSELPSRLWLTGAGWAHHLWFSQLLRTLIFLPLYARHHSCDSPDRHGGCTCSRTAPPPQKPVADARPRSPGLPGSSS